jgi:hypothetical protein
MLCLRMKQHQVKPYFVKKLTRSTTILNYVCKLVIAMNVSIARFSSICVVRIVDYRTSEYN